MTFQQLYYLLEVRRTGSFSRAAKNLFVTQSTISNAVISLEHEVGTAIFVRGKQGLYPTPAGEEILAHATRICQSHSQLTQPKQPKKNAVRIGAAGYTPTNRAFLRLLEENKGRKDISFSLIDGRSKIFNEELIYHRMDLAISQHYSFSLQTVKDTWDRHHLQYEKLVTIPTAICIGPGHDLYHQETVCPQDLEGYPMMDLPAKTMSRSSALKVFLPIQESSSIVACDAGLRKQLLMEGYAYIIRRLPSRAEREQSTLRYIPIEGLSHTIFAVTNPIYKASPEIERYMELLKEEIATEEY